MGAYYNPAIKVNQEEFLDEYVRFSPYPFNNGAKLAEHGYLANPFVNGVLNTIPLDKEFKLIWLCDYCDDEDINWNTIKERVLKNRQLLARKKPENVYYFNINKKEYVDISQLLKYTIKDEFKYIYVFHPLVLLTNSEKDSAGGGDINKEDMLTQSMKEFYVEYRGHWKGDILIKTRDLKFTEFKNITDSVFFYSN